MTHPDHITNDEVLKRTGSTKLQDTAAERGFRPTSSRSLAFQDRSVVNTSRRNTQKRSPEEDVQEEELELVDME